MEKVYHTMKQVGACSLVLGIMTIVFGVAAGTLMIIDASRLLKNKKELTF